MKRKYEHTAVAQLKLGVVIIAIGMLVMWLTSCDGDDNNRKADVKADHPPFSEFWFSSNVEVESLDDSQFEKVNYYNVWGDMHASNTPVEEYEYSSINDGKIPDGSTLLVTNSTNTTSFIATGELTRTGSQLPDDADPILWDDKTCYYAIEVDGNKQTQTITRATFRVYNSKFDASYDVTSKMIMMVDDERIILTNDQSDVSGLSHFRITLRIDKL
jgi:hypothetical protein